MKQTALLNTEYIGLVCVGLVLFLTAFLAVIKMTFLNKKQNKYFEKMSHLALGEKNER